ncbi:hypothetical protein RBU61_00500 [Tissierella sp. MB52-C2]|uniref:leucine-rich repeat domain-containing protein n=1 Tax=Tissierella sp. MB52-C2 TaxID=3070999 RepID=UPI00280A7D89|nr:leucine-rich repeat domain-containing protein [Tissierella sp. MB52-C2]WMM25170.1 hypothetical protein RBU61_00500 [Tissierella sp. MB52-C2]
MKELDTDSLPMISGTNRGIKDLTGLEYAINLESIDLSENSISDLSPIKDLTKLKYIEVDRNDISDLTPLSNLKELEHLNIYNNAGIKDVKPISHSTKLKWIDMHFCNRKTEPVNVEELGTLVNLEFLSIDDNFVEDISFVKNLSKLSSFSCNNNHVLDLTEVDDLAARAYNDWSGDYFVNMYGQSLKEPVEVKVSSEGTTFEMDDPVTGNKKYKERVEKEEGVQVPVIQALEDVDFLEVRYNHDNNKIELIISENDTDEVRELEYEISAEYGMYNLKIIFNITQEAKK